MDKGVVILAVVDIILKVGDGSSGTGVVELHKIAAHRGGELDDGARIGSD